MLGAKSCIVSNEATSHEPDVTPPQWPNGDDLDPRGLLGLPAAFTAYLQTELRQPVKQQQIALEAAVERLTKIRSRLAARLAIRIIVTCSSLGLIKLAASGKGFSLKWLHP